MRKHREDDHPDDRYHQSEAVITAVMLAADSGTNIAEALEAADVVIWKGRYLGDPRTFLVIEPAEDRSPRIVLSAGSAVGIFQAVMSLVGDGRAVGGRT